ncbi:MAG: hypothetical protein NTW26_07885 [bacterium]|nr:hypothetical protein [bacterium]
MAGKRTLIIVILVVVTLGAGVLAVILNIKTVDVYGDVTATIFFWNLSDAETERLLGLAEEARQKGDYEGALTLVTFAYTYNDGENKGDLLLLWSALLLDQGKSSDACQVLDELVAFYPSGDSFECGKLGEMVLDQLDRNLVTEDGFRYATAVKLRGYCAQVGSDSLAAVDAVFDRELDRSYDVEFAYDILETELTQVDEKRSLEGESLAGEEKPEEETLDDPFAGLSESERALIEEALAAARTQEGPKWKATTRIRCTLPGFTLREVLDYLGLDPYTGRPVVAGPEPVDKPVGG